MRDDHVLHMSCCHSDAIGHFASLLRVWPRAAVCGFADPGTESEECMRSGGSIAARFFNRCANYDPLRADSRGCLNILRD